MGQFPNTCTVISYHTMSNLKVTSQEVTSGSYCIPAMLGENGLVRTQLCVLCWANCTVHTWGQIHAGGSASAALPAHHLHGGARTGAKGEQAEETSTRPARGQPPRHCQHPTQPWSKLPGSGGGGEEAPVNFQPCDSKNTNIKADAGSMFNHEKLYAKIFT